MMRMSLVGGALILPLWGGIQAANAFTRARVRSMDAQAAKDSGPPST